MSHAPPGCARPDDGPRPLADSGHARGRHAGNNSHFGFANKHLRRRPAPAGPAPSGHIVTDRTPIGQRALPTPLKPGPPPLYAPPLCRPCVALRRPSMPNSKYFIKDIRPMPIKSIFPLRTRVLSRATRPRARVCAPSRRAPPPAGRSPVRAARRLSSSSTRRTKRHESPTHQAPRVDTPRLCAPSLRAACGLVRRFI